MQQKKRNAAKTVVDSIDLTGERPGEPPVDVVEMISLDADTMNQYAIDHQARTSAKD